MRLRLLLPLLLLAITGSLLAGCGGSDKLSSEQRKQLQTRGETWAREMQDIAMQQMDCDFSDARCRQRGVRKVSGSTDRFARYVDGLAADVSGACQRNLQQGSTALHRLARLMRRAARYNTSSSSGQRRLMRATRANLRLAKQASTAFRAAEDSCQ